MKVTGKYVGAQLTLDGKLSVTFQIDDKAIALPELDKLNTDKETILDIEVKKHREKRSLDANALLWACIGDLSKALRADKWDIYLLMLKRYGVFTYMSIREDALEKLKLIWRECEEVGRKTVNGRTEVEVLCYYGSSTYDRGEFSALLDGVISEMKEAGLHIPLPESIERSLDLWQKRNG